MSSRTPGQRLTPRQQRIALGTGFCAALLGVVGAWWVLRDHLPGGMADGLLGGGLASIAVLAVAALRVSRRPDRTSVAERAWLRAGDERDDAVLTRALAVLGLVAVPLTGAAGVALALGVDTSMTMALLLWTELLVGTAAFVVINRRG